MTIMQLRNWSFGIDTPGRVSGEVYGNPKFADGTFVTTSRITAVDPVAKVVRTHSGSLYKLEEPVADYEVCFPNAKERFFNTAATNVDVFSVDPS
jgi:hypothetical protein